MAELNLNAPCPCGSKKLPLECCWRGAYGLVVPEADTRPERPKTGHANPDCYARVLNDCSPDISKEHYVSLNVLESLGWGGTLQVMNPPWAPGKTVTVTPASFFHKVLCRRHNNVLLPLDTTGGEFFRTIQRGFDTKRAPFAVNGINLERWMLKWLVGMSAGRYRDESGRVLDPWTPPDLWVRILFGELTFPPACGLYVDGTLGRSVAPAAGLVSERFDINGELAGSASR